MCPTMLGSVVIETFFNFSLLYLFTLPATRNHSHICASINYYKFRETLQRWLISSQVWTALLNYGYVGCIRDLFVDGQSKDIRRLAEAQRAVGVKPSCSREPPKQCLSNPCQHNGICREGWNRYVCDCSGTGYLGRSCERGKSVVVGGWEKKEDKLE